LGVVPILTPLYLGNGKSLKKSVGILLKDNFIRNIKKPSRLVVIEFL
jgi:hypothetical protein